MLFTDFSAYLTTDLVQPGIILSSNEADVTPSPASVSLYGWRPGAAVAAGPSVRSYRPPPRSAHRRPGFCSLLPEHAVCRFDRAILRRPLYPGNQHLFYLDRGLCVDSGSVWGNRFNQNHGCADLIVLLAPVIGPLAGAGYDGDALETAVCHYWRAGPGGLGLLLFKMPETVISQGGILNRGSAG